MTNHHFSISSGNVNYGFNTEGCASDKFKKDLRCMSFKDLKALLKDPTLTDVERMEVLRELERRANETFDEDGSPDAKADKKELCELMNKLKRGEPLSECEMDRLAELLGLDHKDMDKPVEHSQPKEPPKDPEPETPKDPEPEPPKDPEPEPPKDPEPSKTPATPNDDLPLPTDESELAEHVKGMSEEALREKLKDPDLTYAQWAAINYELYSREWNRRMNAGDTEGAERLQTLYLKSISGTLGAEDKKEYANALGIEEDEVYTPPPLPADEAGTAERAKNMSDAEIRERLDNDSTLTQAQRKALLDELIARKSNSLPTSDAAGRKELADLQEKMHKDELNPAERRRLAELLGISPDSLYQPEYPPLPTNWKELEEEVSKMSEEEVKNRLKDRSLTFEQRKELIDRLTEFAKGRTDDDGDERLDLLNFWFDIGRLTPEQEKEFADKLGIPVDWLYRRPH